MNMTKMDGAERKRREAIKFYEELNGPIRQTEITTQSPNQYQAEQLVEITSENLKTFLMQNPVILSNSSLYRLAHQAVEALGNLSDNLADRHSKENQHQA